VDLREAIPGGHLAEVPSVEYLRCNWSMPLAPFLLNARLNPDAADAGTDKHS